MSEKESKGVDGSQEGGAGKPKGSLIHHYLIARYEQRGLELPHDRLDSGEEVLPVFSSRKAARRFLLSRTLGERWLVRDFSDGELVSVLFALRAGVTLISIDPIPGLRVDEDFPVSSFVDRDGYIDSLLMRS